MEFSVPAESLVKPKKARRKVSTLNLLENRKIWSMKGMMTPNVTGSPGTFTKGLIQGLGDLELRGQVETIQTTPLLISASIQSRVLETCGDWLSLNIQRETNV